MSGKLSALGKTGWVFLALGAASLIAAAIVIPLTVFSGDSASKTSGSTPTSRPTVSTATHLQKNCGQSGCAVANMVLAEAHYTVFFGASCTGLFGSWYLNVVEGGPNDVPKPSYALRWAFSPNSSVAHPSAEIAISAPTRAHVDMKLVDGVLRIAGTTAAGLEVSATGSLVVEVSQKGSNPALKFTETGVADVERALHISSPFNVNARPVSVPVRIVQQTDNC